jgi:hypothetical protein
MPPERNLLFPNNRIRKTNSSQPCQRKKGNRATSLEGKAISSQNAVKTGLDAKSEVMRCESRDEYNLLIAEKASGTEAARPDGGAAFPAC